MRRAFALAQAVDALLEHTRRFCYEVMLSAFVFGLAVGGLWVRGKMDKFRRPEFVLGVVQLIMGIAAVATLPAYRWAVGGVGWLLTGTETARTSEEAAGSAVTSDEAAALEAVVSDEAERSRLRTTVYQVWVAQSSTWGAASQPTTSTTATSTMMPTAFFTHMPGL